MMTPGEVRGLTTFIRSIRGDEEWHTTTITTAIAKLQDEGYSTQDITEACTAIALDRNNKFPSMLSMKAPEMIRRKHEQKVKPRPTGPGKLGDQYKCDTCGKTEAQCQSDATNLNGADHGFIPVARRDLDRDQMHADGRIAAARDEALAKAPANLFKLPDDIASDPQIQEEQAS
jgi:hypothetical protein